jgi:hypothetical protein
MHEEVEEVGEVKEEGIQVMPACHCEEALRADAAIPLKYEIASSLRSSQRRMTEINEATK